MAWLDTGTHESLMDLAVHSGHRKAASTDGGVSGGDRLKLSDYLLAEIKEIAEKPTLAELRERLHKRKPVSAQIDPAHLVREERKTR